MHGSPTDSAADVRSGTVMSALAPVALLVHPVDPAPTLDRAAAGRYVLSCRTPGGGYSFYRTPDWNVEEPNAPDTLAALESLRILGVEAPEAEDTSRWLRGLQEENGSYPTLTIGWAALRSCSLLEVQPRCSPITWLRGWQETLLAEQREREHGGELHDLLHFVELARLTGLGPGAEAIAAVTEMLERWRDSSGGGAAPSADLETSAIALQLAELADLPLGYGGETEAFVRSCEDAVLGLRLCPSGRATSVGALWGGLTILRVLGRRPGHRESIAMNLALLQNRNGGLGARHCAISTLRHTWLGLEASQLLNDLTEVQP